MPKKVPVSTFPARLRELRLRAGLQQNELAERAGLHHVYLSQLESGRYTPSLDVAARLAAVLDCLVDDLRTPPGSATHHPVARR